MQDFIFSIFNLCDLSFRDKENLISNVVSIKSIFLIIKPKELNMQDDFMLEK
jgi:hypothetical protein